MAVHQQTEELKALKETGLCHQGTIVVVDFVFLYVRLIGKEVIIVTQASLSRVGNNLAIVYRSYAGTGGVDAAIIHTVHHHGPDIC